MSSKEYKWLPHLESSIPESAMGYTATMYAIALEGWRRGLNLKFVKTNRTKSNTVFELSNNEKSHRFVSSRGDLVTTEALRICRNKSKTKEYLEKKGIPTPLGKDFSEEISNEEIIKEIESLKFPLVIKPIDGTGGRGVIANINTTQEFIDSLKYVRNDLGFKHVIVEEHFTGEDYRVYVVGDEVIAATKRIPANIQGDGKQTIRQLISEKNQTRIDSKLYRSSLIKIDKELRDMLKKEGYTLDSVPSQGKIVYLKSKNNISAGGDPVDITKELSDEIKEIAVNGLKAIPGIPHGGLDLLVNKEENKAVIIEINSQASIRLNLFPLKGTARDIPTKIIDYYFPDTRSNHNLPLYFDFEPVWKEFRNGTSKQIEIPPIPEGDVILTRFLVSGKLQRVGFGNWVKTITQNLGIHGFVRHLKNGNVSIVVCGNGNSIKEFKKILLEQSVEKFTISEIKERKRSTPVPIGFKIINPEQDSIIKDGYYPVRLKDPKAKIAKKKVKSTKTVKKRSKAKSTDYEKEYNKILQSTSWKITKPIRFLGQYVKKIKKIIERDLFRGN